MGLRPRARELTTMTRKQPAPIKASVERSPTGSARGPSGWDAIAPFGHPSINAPITRTSRPLRASAREHRQRGAGASEISLDLSLAASSGRTLASLNAYEIVHSGYDFFAHKSSRRQAAQPADNGADAQRPAGAVWGFHGYLHMFNRGLISSRWAAPLSRLSTTSA
jgi:hypothetical protein